MKAIYEYGNGELGETVGLQGFGRDIVERVLKEHDVIRIWLLLDDEDDDVSLLDADWTLETWWVTRADGAVAKVNLGTYHPDEDDIWTAIEKQYPEAWDLIPEGGIEWGGTTEYRLWDLQVWPGQGERLASWLQDLRYAVVETWRNGVMDGRPETVTWHPSEEEALKAARLAWSYLTPEENAKYRVLVVLRDPEEEDVLAGKVLWTSEEADA